MPGTNRKWKSRMMKATKSKESPIKCYRVNEVRTVMVKPPMELTKYQQHGEWVKASIPKKKKMKLNRHEKLLGLDKMVEIYGSYGLDDVVDRYRLEKYLCHQTIEKKKRKLAKLEKALTTIIKKKF